MAAASAIVPSVARTFALDEFLAGRIVWLYMLPYGLSALVYGPLARGLDCKKILCFCLGVFSLANLLSAQAANLNILFIGRLLAGVSGAAVIPVSLILIAKTSDPQERGKKVGGFFSLTFVSSLLGLFLSGVLFWRWIFLLPAIAAALVALGIYFYFPHLAFMFYQADFVPGAGEKKKTGIHFNYRQVLGEKPVYRLFIYIFFISFIYHGIRQWLGVYFSKTYAFEQFLISMLLTTISLSGILGESLGGVLADRIGRIKIVNVGSGLMLVSLIVLLFKNNLIVLFMIMFVWGLGWTFNHAGISTFLTDLPSRYLYESASLNSSVRFLSGGLGAVCAGFLARKSFSLEFAIFAFSLLILFVFGKKAITSRPEEKKAWAEA